jgi:hypothetical protein
VLETLNILPYHPHTISIQSTVGWICILDNLWNPFSQFLVLSLNLCVYWWNLSALCSVLSIYMLQLSWLSCVC